MAPHVASVTAYDLTPAMLGVVAAEAAARGLHVQTRQGAAEDLPFADAAFDLVVSRFSAHHWRDLDAALRGVRRVLAPGGRVLLMDSISPGPPLLDTLLQTMELLRDPSHGRNYTAAEWHAALARAGLPVKSTLARRLRLNSAPGLRGWTHRSCMWRRSARCRTARPHRRERTSASSRMAASGWICWRWKWAESVRQALFRRRVGFSPPACAPMVG